MITCVNLKGLFMHGEYLFQQSLQSRANACMNACKSACLSISLVNVVRPNILNYYLELTQSQEKKKKLTTIKFFCLSKKLTKQQSQSFSTDFKDRIKKSEKKKKFVSIQKNYKLAIEKKLIRKISISFLPKKNCYNLV